MVLSSIFAKMSFSQNMIHFALKKCSQVGSLSELKSCPSLGEKPTCVARCSRSVKNTIKHPARVYHIDIMQVIPISDHFGTLEKGQFPSKNVLFSPVKVPSLLKGTILGHTHHIIIDLSGWAPLIQCKVSLKHKLGL